MLCLHPIAARPSVKHLAFSKGVGCSLFVNKSNIIINLKLIISIKVWYYFLDRSYCSKVCLSNRAIRFRDRCRYKTVHSDCPLGYLDSSGDWSSSIHKLKRCNFWPDCPNLENVASYLCLCKLWDSFQSCFLWIQSHCSCLDLFSKFRLSNHIKKKHLNLLRLSHLGPWNPNGQVHVGFKFLSRLHWLPWENNIIKSS